MAERDRNFQMKTASVTVIIVTPHFIVSSGNCVVTGETVISLIVTLFIYNAVIHITGRESSLRLTLKI